MMVILVLSLHTYNNLVFVLTYFWLNAFLEGISPMFSRVSISSRSFRRGSLTNFYNKETDLHIYYALVALTTPYHTSCSKWSELGLLIFILSDRNLSILKSIQSFSKSIESKVYLGVTLRCFLTSNSQYVHKQGWEYRFDVLGERKKGLIIMLGPGQAPIYQCSQKLIENKDSIIDLHRIQHHHLHQVVNKPLEFYQVGNILVYASVLSFIQTMSSRNSN